MANRHNKTPVFRIKMELERDTLLQFCELNLISPIMSLSARFLYEIHAKLDPLSRSSGPRCERASCSRGFERINRYSPDSDLLLHKAEQSAAIRNCQSIIQALSIRGICT